MKALEKLNELTKEVVKELFEELFEEKLKKQTEEIEKMLQKYMAFNSAEHSPLSSTTETAVDIQFISPNAKQGEFYQTIISDEEISELSLPEDSGLVWHTDKSTLEGTPKICGDLEINALLKDGRKKCYRLVVNPDPRSLWQNIPSDPNTPFYKTDSTNAQITTDFGTIIGARMRGRSHAQKGSCCDDDFTMSYHQPTGMHLLVVSDGAGSAEFSRYGSQLVVNAVRDEANKFLNDSSRSYRDFHKVNAKDRQSLVEGFFTHLVRAAYNAQEKAVIAQDVPDLKSLSCTLLIGFSLKTEDNQWFSAAYWIGDGAIALWQPSTQQVSLMGQGDSGQYSGETLFLNAEEANRLGSRCYERIAMQYSEEPAVLVLMSDGVSDPKFKSDADLSNPQSWQKLWEEIQCPLSEANPAQSLETWLDFFSKGEHDDRTLAMFIPNELTSDFARKSEEMTACSDDHLEELQAQEQLSLQDSADTVKNETALRVNLDKSDVIDVPKSAGTEEHSIRSVKEGNQNE